MATAPNLPTDVVPGQPGHAALHNDVNASVNALAEDTGWSELLTAAEAGAPVFGRKIGNFVQLAFDPARAWTAYNPVGADALIAAEYRPTLGHVSILVAAEGQGGTLNLSVDGYLTLGTPLVGAEEFYGSGSVTYLAD
jgi:hypothetical protein